MQDRINFRFWDTQKRVMLDWDCICQTAFNCTREKGNKAQRYGLMYWAFTTPSRFIPLQCTSKKDKNNKLIFEGDIIREYDEYGYVMIKEVDFLEDVMFGFNINVEFDYEIIGNIYENPELLEENRC